MLPPTLAAALSATLLAGAASAQDGRLAVGGNIGTPGLGAEVQYKLNDNFVVRGGGDWMNFDFDRTYSGVDYSPKLKTGAGGAFVDWRPGDGYFGELPLLDAASRQERRTRARGVAWKLESRPR